MLRSFKSMPGDGSPALESPWSMKSICHMYDMILPITLSVPFPSINHCRMPIYSSRECLQMLLRETTNWAQHCARTAWLRPRRNSALLLSSPPKRRARAPGSAASDTARSSYGTRTACVEVPRLPCGGSEGEHVPTVQSQRRL